MATRDHPLIVGTAGHIDHGKTSLVKALTGVDLDALPEEKERGITIALGFTSLALTEGSLAFVDVPGHERLVRTMVAGASGVDAVLLCVSAQEGVMPQTREHLDILGLLGVEQGIIALTRADLVEPELAEMAEEDVREVVQGTFLEDAPIVHTSAVDGRGIEALRTALAALPGTRRSHLGPFRLPVDRCFVRKGFGSVITGTIQSGRVSEGDAVALLPAGTPARVRGLQVHGQPAEQAQAGMRCALNLAGVDKEELPRGCVVGSPSGVACTSILDVRYRHLASAPPLEAGTRVRLLLHTAETLAVADPLDPPDAPVLPGTTRWLQLRLSQPVAMLPGDRFVLRRESPITTLGGGEVVDPWAPRTRRKDALQAVELLEQMAAGEDLARIERKGPAGLSAAEAQERLGGTPKGAVCLGDTLFSEPRVEQMAAHLEQGLAYWHAAHPLGTGAPRRTLHRGPLAGLDARAFEALVERVSQEGRVVLEGPRVALAGHRVELSDADQASIDALMQRLADAGLAPPATPELLEGSGITEDHLALLLGRGTLERIEGRLVRGDHLAELVVSVRAFLAENSTLSTGDFKALTGLTRRHAIPLLEWLDARGITIRLGDVRVPGNG